MTDVQAPAQATHRRWLREGGYALLSGLLALAVAIVELQVWDANLRVPFVGASSDAAQALTVITTIVQEGWFWDASNLGAPFGAQQYDFGAPFGDTFNLLIVRLFAFVVADPGFLLNAYFLATFVLCAASAYLVLRTLRFSVLICIAGGVLFSLLPFHFLRGEVHAWVSGYWGVPIGAWLVLGVLGHVEIARRVPGREGWRAWVSKRNAVVPVAAFVVAGTFVYYAIFYVLVLTGVAVMVAYRRRTIRAAAGAIVVMSLILGSFAISALPTFVYQARHGTNPVVGVRSPAEAEIYGLKATQMLLPTTEDRIGPLKDIGRDYALTSPLQSEGPSPYLGILLGLAFLVAAGYALLAGQHARAGGRSELVRDSGTVGLIAFVIGTVGGVSSLVSYLVTAQMRGWNRISVVIAFFAVIALCAGFEFLAARLRTGGEQRWRPRAAVGAIVGLTAFGVWQQAGVAAPPDYAGNTRAYYDIGLLVGHLERELPHGASVLQLPYTPYPEHGPVNGMADYEHLAAFVHSDDLRWSAGQMKGRPQDWLALTYRMTPEELVSGATAAGFGAVWVNRAGYPDNGKRVESALQRIGATQMGATRDARIAVYRLDRVARRIERSAPAGVRIAAGSHLVRPVELAWSGFAKPDEQPLGLSRFAAKVARIRFEVPDGGTRRIVLRGSLLSTTNAVVRAQLPGGRTRALSTSGEGVPFELSFAVRPGDDTITFRTDAPSVASPNDDRDLRYVVADLSVLDPAIVTLARALTRK